MRIREFAPAAATSRISAADPTIRSAHDEPVASTGKEIIQTTAKHEVAKEATVHAFEHMARMIEADVVALLPRLQNSATPGVAQVVAIALTAKNLYNRQWTAATAAAASAVPYAPVAIAAMATEMAAELYGKYFIKQTSRRPADPTLDSVQDPIGTQQRMGYLVDEISKELKIFWDQGIARTRQLADPNSANSLARVTARNAPRGVGPAIQNPITGL